MRDTISSRIVILITSIAIPSLVFLAAFFFLPGWNVASEGFAHKKIIIHRGASFRSILTSLQDNRVLRRQRPLIITAAIFPDLRNIKPGRYSIPSGLSNHTLLTYLHNHPQDEERVMIPEGVRKERIAAIVSSHLDIDSLSFINSATDRALLDSLGIQAGSFEGYFFPGTYNFPWASTSEEVIRFLVGRFQAFYHDSLKTVSSLKGLDELALLTLASIVEAETPLDEEKPLIAGVYLNRLRKNMKIQADPTVQYALGGEPRRLLYKDLSIDSPYNTYKYKGLPPAPIGNPGAASIMAVLYPAETDYLYFVATGNGGHNFAKTAGEHAENVKKYRRARQKP
ncbi:MAG: endolytic transglycosylase MltG [Chlorobium sp.]|nr:endolytic transglycosylase MltG [Chlorobium sp.]MCW8815593.1 endolytic transglycosylase MltG [Chlorobium sp.]MCW8819716.1 endolytic transglycosylase MltG [Ignavibacteriaceae bacterium]